MRSVYRMLSGAILVVTSVSVSRAGWVYQTDFETAPGTGYDLFYGAAQSTAQALSPTHSIQLPMATSADTPLIRVVPPNGVTLGQITGDFSAYVPSSSADVAPYMYFGVDSNRDGTWDDDGTSTGDSLVLAFSGGAIPASIPQDQWFQTGLNGQTKVHVTDGRQGLVAGTYSSSGTQDTLNALRSVAVPGGGTWGDLAVLRVYIAAGEWPGVSTYNAYVDNLNVSSPSPVPLPAAAWAGMTLLVGLAGAGGVTRLRRQMA